MPIIQSLNQNQQKFALILDWDDTLTNEIDRMREVTRKINQQFAKSEAY